MIRRTFADIHPEFAKLQNSDIVLIPVGYDGTVTGEKGAENGPDAFLNASKKLELYDIETDSEVYKNGIYLNKLMNWFSSPQAMVNKVYNTVCKYIDMGKFVTIIGGEHSISIGAIRAFTEHYDELTVLHIDAHADLRPVYNNSIFNHACAVHEASKTSNLIQVGIRSMDISEKEFMTKEKVFFGNDIANDQNWSEDALNQMTENVYITFDLDAFDPSIMPSVGTPEPGGLYWEETLNFLDKVFALKNVVGFDIVELCPNVFDKTSDYMAVKLYYKMLSYKYFYLPENTAAKEKKEEIDHLEEVAI